MGAGCARKTNYVSRGLGLWATVQEGREAGESVIHMTNDSIDHAYVMKP